MAGPEYYLLCHLVVVVVLCVCVCSGTDSRASFAITAKGILPSKVTCCV